MFIIGQSRNILQIKYCAELLSTFWANYWPFYNYRSVTSTFLDVTYFDVSVKKLNVLAFSRDFCNITRQKWYWEYKSVSKDAIRIFKAFHFQKMKLSYMEITLDSKYYCPTTWNVSVASQEYEQLTLWILMDSFFWFVTINSRYSIVHILGCQDIFFKNIVLFCLKICFTFTYNVEPDEMSQYAAFNLGLYCL